MTEKEHDDLAIDNLPNRLTLFRMALIPIVVTCLFLEGQDWPGLHSWHGGLGHIAAGIFVLASITDFVDGHIARKRDQVTVFGSFLDPIADKFLVASSLVMLLSLGRVSSLAVVILILREFYMTSLRLLASREGLQIPVNFLGKWKTTTQLVGIPLLMANGHPWGISMALLGNLCIYAAIFLSLYSALIYSLGPIKKLQSIRSGLRAKKQTRQKAIKEGLRPENLEHDGRLPEERKAYKAAKRRWAIQKSKL